MLGKMIEEALEAERKAADLVAAAQKNAEQKEHDFDTRAVSELKNIEEEARSILRQALENARLQNEAAMENELQRIREESEDFLEKNENLISEAVKGVCDILSETAGTGEER